MKNYQAEVDLLFKPISRRSDHIHYNPVTEDQFVPARDSIKEQKLKAIAALKAGDWFEAQRPPDAPELPLGQRNWVDARDKAIINEDWIACIVARFGESIARHGYRTEGHPLFEEFARGLMASDMWPVEMHNDPELLRRYPPKVVPGLRHGIWSPSE